MAEMRKEKEPRTILQRPLDVERPGYGDRPERDDPALNEPGYPGGARGKSELGEPPSDLDVTKGSAGVEPAEPGDWQDAQGPREQVNQPLRQGESKEIRKGGAESPPDKAPQPLRQGESSASRKGGVVEAPKR